MIQKAQIYLGLMLIICSCGPSAEEVKQRQIFEADSLAIVEERNAEELR
jgi:hypothetical protein